LISRTCCRGTHITNPSARYHIARIYGGALASERIGRQDPIQSSNCGGAAATTFILFSSLLSVGSYRRLRKLCHSQLKILVGGRCSDAIILLAHAVK
jgi:hypothetical protein